MNKRSANKKLFAALIGAFFLFVVGMLTLSAGAWTLPALVGCAYLVSLLFLSVFEEERPGLKSAGRAIGALAGLGAALLIGALAEVSAAKLLALCAFCVALGTTYREWLRVV